MSLNYSYALWHQTIVWTIVSIFLLIDFYVNNKCLIYFLPTFFSTKLIVFLECLLLLVSISNTVYCYISYLILFVKHRVKQETKNLKNVTSSLHLNKSDRILNPNILEKNKVTCLSSISNFLDNFFKASILKPNSSELNSLLNINYSPVNDASLSSTISYHDSPLNKSLSSIYTNQQLDCFLSNENCDSLTENSTTNLFANSFCDEERHYKTGTHFVSSEKTDNAINQVKKFVMSKQTKIPLISRTFSESLKKRTRESSPISSFSSKSLQQPGFGNKQRYHESDLHQIFLDYNINISNLDYYELKLRIWICNTIFRPLIEKIDDLNNVLKEKYSSLHLKIGFTTPETFKSILSTKIELCNSYLPFILPYLRIHCNQNYLLQRIRLLAKNVAMECFKWNNGSAEDIFDETDGKLKNLSWSERLPTDSFIVWSAFCTYMDYHLAPCPNYLTGDFFKPFSNVYCLKGDTQPTTLHATTNAFFIRLISENPPIFEFIFNGGNDIVVPCKDNGNIWVVMILFFAHVEKFNDSRIGFLHLSSIHLDIFDN